MVFQVTSYGICKIEKGFKSVFPCVATGSLSHGHAMSDQGSGSEGHEISMKC